MQSSLLAYICYTNNGKQQKTTKMHTVNLTTANNGNQTVKINRTAVVFTPAFTAKIGKMRAKKMLTSADMPTIGKFTIIALGNGRFKMGYDKNYMTVTAAIITIKGNQITAIEAR